MDAQLKKGILELAVIQEIAKRDMYGYDLARDLGEYYTDVDIRAFYTILGRLSRKEYLITYEGQLSHGPTRKYYRITEKGRGYLSERMKEWEELKQIQSRLSDESQ